MIYINNENWIRAELSDTSIILKDDHRDNFYYGEWISGIFRKGLWRNGYFFVGGIWLSGKWEKGYVYVSEKHCYMTTLTPKAFRKPKLTLSLNSAKYQ